MRFIIILLLTIQTIASPARQIPIEKPNSYWVAGKSQEFVDALNYDTKLFLEAEYNRDKSLGALTPETFEGNWSRIEHKKNIPLNHCKSEGTFIRKYGR